jgi:hypothetical protein
MANTANGASAHATTPPNSPAFEEQLGLSAIFSLLSGAGAFDLRDPRTGVARLRFLRKQYITHFDDLNALSEELAAQACAIDFFANDVVPTLGLTPYQNKALLGLLMPMSHRAAALSSNLQRAI